MRFVLASVLAAAAALFLTACERPVEEGPPMEADAPPVAETPPAQAPTVAQVPPFEELDVANEGFITREEAEEFPPLAENFERYDRDGDGVIDQAEFSQFVAEVETGVMPMPTDEPRPAAPPPPAEGVEPPAEPRSGM
jgi:hypothetical protein